MKVAVTSFTIYLRSWPILARYAFGLGIFQNKVVFENNSELGPSGRYYAKAALNFVKNKLDNRTAISLKIFS